MDDPSTRDLASEDFEWPDPGTLLPDEAMRLLDDFEEEAKKANKRADTLKERKRTAKIIALDTLKQYRLKSATTETADGKDVRYTPYDFEIFTVEEPRAFMEWALKQDENYFDNAPKLREEVFLSNMRRMYKDGEPLPPGVKRYTEPRLSRSATVAGKGKKR